MPSIVFTAYGVTAEVAVDDDALAEKVRRVLPPGWRPADPDVVETRVELRGSEVLIDGARFRWTRRATAVDVLDAAIRSRVSLLAPDHVFVHAGVVAVEGRAIVLPGPSLAGKSTLVAALISRGAAYLSDEYAVLDGEGMVHPYPKPVSLRVEGGSLAQWDAPIERFGAVAAEDPVPVGLIAITRYERGAEWRPERHGSAHGAMALLENAVPARERPAETLLAVTRASSAALVLDGPRGGAIDTARALAEMLSVGV